MRAKRSSLVRPTGSPQSLCLFSALVQTICLTVRAYLNTQEYGLFYSVLLLLLLLLLLCACLTPTGGLIPDHQAISFSHRCLGSFLGSWLFPTNKFLDYYYYIIVIMFVYYNYYFHFYYYQRLSFQLVSVPINNIV